MSKMSRSTHGLSTVLGEEWRDDALCSRDPGLWDDANGLAIHLCRSHCPVLGPCTADAHRRPPMEGVQAGLAWVQVTRSRLEGMPGRVQPTPIGCGTDCRVWREGRG